MGNHIPRNGGGDKARIMKTNGELFKLKTPAQAKDIIKDYPGYVLLDSDEFVRFNLRAKPLSPGTQLQPKKIYLLVQLPRFPTPSDNYQRKSIRRTQSDVESNVQDRLDSLMSRRRRSLSDLPRTDSRNDHASPRRAMSLPCSPRSPGSGDGGGPVRFKMRLPKAQVERIMEESKDKAEMAKRILDLCMEESEAGAGGEGMAAQSSTVMLPTVEEEPDGTKKSNNKDKDLASKYCLDFQSLCSPCTTSHSKYGRLTYE